MACAHSSTILQHACAPATHPHVAALARLLLQHLVGIGARRLALVCLHQRRNVPLGVHQLLHAPEAELEQLALQARQVVALRGREEAEA